jgi:enoyl-CoA hydratase
VALVTINRPDARNAVNVEVAEMLAGLVEAIEADPEIWAAVITGAGNNVFSAGADLKVVSAGGLNALFPAPGGFGGFVHAKRTKPWIAAVEGLALAGGFEIALACDMIVASENSAFALPEVKRGLVASAGGLYRLVRALPRAIAIELIVSGERLPAARAHQLGLVNRLVSAGDAVAAALGLAASICENAPLAVRESLVVARLAFDLDQDRLNALSNAAQERLSTTEDFREGPLAFVEKRQPVWKGR